MKKHGVLLTSRLKTDYGYQYIINVPYTNADSFDQLKSVIGDRITSALKLAINDNIVAKKADVVAHSMGGVITKLYGNESNINSITTVGTPHFGSPLANKIWELVNDETDSFENFLATLLERSGHPARNGAISDRRTTSLHVEADRINVPLCVIAGVSTIEDQAIKFVNLLKIVYGFQIYPPLEDSLLKLNQYFFNGEANDWIVSESSQKGGYDGAVVDDVEWHCTEPTDEQVLQKIINFLHRTSNTTSTSLTASTSKNVFNAQAEETKSNDTNKLLSALSNMKMGISSGQVQIINPNEGQVFQAGDTVNVEVSVSNENASVIIATSTGESTLIKQAPYNFQFVIPNEVIGSLNILAGARDDTGYIGSDEVTINVATTSNLTDIKVYPETTPVYLTVGAKLPLSIYGLYDDNVERKITSSSSGISYTSSNPDVVEVSTEGLVTVKSQGEAVIAIEHSGVKKEITIIGKSEPDISCSPDSYDFGSVSVGGTSEAKNFTVTNTGNADLVIDTISITGADASVFSIQNDNCSGRTIAASEGCSVGIVFTPTSDGTKSAYLTIPSNDPDTQNVIVRLTGTGGSVPTPTPSPTPTPVPPEVNSTDPANGATGVAIDTTITATFSKTMDANTISTNTFTVSNGNGNITGTVLYSGTTATFTPSSSLTYSTNYTATISTGAKDIDGMSISSAYSWSFTTGIAPNSAPIANAGNDQSVYVNDTVTLAGSGSYDVDGNLLTYTWAFTTKPDGSSAALSDSTAVNPTFTVDKAGTYVVSLFVNDGMVDSAADTVTISTRNSAPVANAGLDQSVYVGNTVTLDGSGGSDIDGNTLTYSWAFTTRPSGSTATLSNSTSVNPSFTVDKAGTYVASLIVNDGTVNSAPDTITISTINVAPVANAGADQSVNVGVAVTLNGGVSSDADGDTITYSWSFTTKPSGSTAALSGATSANPTFTADKAGTYVVSLIVSDGTLNSSPDTVTITANAVTINVEVKIKPETINLKDKGKFKAVIKFPESYSADTVVLSTVVCGGAHAIKGRFDDEDKDDHHDNRYTARFNVQDLSITASAKKEEVTLTVSGELEDGTKFTGSDTVKVKSREKEKEKGKDKDK